MLLLAYLLSLVYVLLRAVISLQETLYYVQAFLPLVLGFLY